MKQAENIEEFKAYSQNMMHESMEITDRLYGKLAGDEVKREISSFSLSGEMMNCNHEFEQLLMFKQFLKMSKS